MERNSHGEEKTDSGKEEEYESGCDCIGDYGKGNDRDFRGDFDHYSDCVDNGKEWKKIDPVDFFEW